MILDWRKVASGIYDDLKIKISKLKERPSLAAVLVWNNPASISYIKQKKKFAEYVWMDFVFIELSLNITEEELLLIIEDLNIDKKISGYIVQLPLPSHIDSQKIIDKISPEKDVDWFTKENIGKLFLWEDDGMISCTPKWIKKLLDEYGIDLNWKNVTIIGKSNIVGKPLSLLFINNSATVTVCNSRTKNLSEHTLKSDIVVSAAWIPNLVKKEMISPWTVIIDVGFNKIWDKLVWDCDFAELEPDNYITPVPWWVGAMTVAMLIENTYLAHLNNLHE
ncbi:MAG: bifunctional 5,10-methylene-tetrahydrofolate dehydrogenase/5,10-methylene-tetrahydrofolate cyclohydrolase [uncultured bacterium (gcode 4)]|uniref:Bifunctional protein FolD n=1 Tax=uncultured bacterium (gcode 4) TaxID=1234023 RepID=K2FWG9_9BACT|nr:MAG: bifunctional 5,10-methylene-tetrahydrofolate dehydrogenase/5,10-methylene-tetrahydrofolate cyclohydrolase [uncultured bacterium (gcode 4)]